MPNVAVQLSPPRDEQVFEDLCAWKDLPLLGAAGLIDNVQAAKVMAAYAVWFDEVEEEPAGFLARMKRRLLGRPASPSASCSRSSASSIAPPTPPRSRPCARHRRFPASPTGW
jgi:hypothetical protein